MKEKKTGNRIRLHQWAKTFSLLGLLTGATLILASQERVQYKIGEVPNVQLYDQDQRVSDPYGFLEESKFNLLNEKLLVLRDTLEVEAAVVIIPGIDREQYATAKDFAHELFALWEIGDEDTDRGLLILLLTQDGEREVTIETGYGLESELPDGKCKAIQTQHMVPHFAQGDFGTGLIEGVAEIERVLRSSNERDGSEKSSRKLKWLVILWGVLGFIILPLAGGPKPVTPKAGESPYVALARRGKSTGVGCWSIIFLPHHLLFSIFRSKKDKASKVPAIDCEKCKAKGTVKWQGEAEIKQKAMPEQDGMKEYQFVCSNCGFTHHELIPYAYEKPETQTPTSSSHSSGGSHTRGGSWGGGKSGGGGASTKF